jgi:hypothetical protein
MGTTNILRLASIIAYTLPSWIALQATALAADPNEVEFILRGISAARQELRSGQYEAIGTQSTVDQAMPKNDFSGAIKINCAFDERRIRVDNSEEGFVPISKNADATTAKRTTITRKYFRTADQSVAWVTYTDRINITKPDGPMFGRFRFFDVKAMGLYDWRHIAPNRATTLEEILGAYQKNGLTKSVDTSDPQSVKLSFLHDTNNRGDELRYWVSPKEGFSVLRSEIRTRNGTETAGQWTVNEESRTSWDQIKGVWVPIHCEMRLLKTVSEQNISLDFKWKSVNEALDDSLFNWKDFNAPASIWVVDSRYGEPVVVRNPKERNLIVAVSPLRLWLILLNAAVVLFLVLIYLYRRKLASR